MKSQSDQPNKVYNKYPHLQIVVDEKKDQKFKPSLPVNVSILPLHQSNSGIDRLINQRLESGEHLILLNQIIDQLKEETIQLRKIMQKYQIETLKSFVELHRPLLDQLLDEVVETKLRETNSHMLVLNQIIKDILES